MFTLVAVAVQVEALAVTLEAQAAMVAAEPVAAMVRQVLLEQQILAVAVAAEETNQVLVAQADLVL